MWILLILGLAGVGFYEFTKKQNCCGGSLPASCGISYCAGCCVNCCGQISADPSTWPSGDQVWDVCQAIAMAEGANVAGSDPDRHNNPGDLSKGDEHGQAVAGYVNLPDGETLINFSTKQGGWQALYTKINNIRMGISLTFSPSMSWTQIGDKYAGDSADWVSNVTSALGVSPSDSFGSYFS